MRIERVSLEQMYREVEAYIFKRKGARVTIDIEQTLNPFELQRQYHLLNLAYNEALKHKQNED